MTYVMFWCMTYQYIHTLFERMNGYNMKKVFKPLAMMLVALVMFGTMTTTTFADSIKKNDGVAYRYSDSNTKIGKYTGWAKTSKGKIYYRNGIKVTKNTIINGIRYKFNKQGICTGKYTGFVKSTKGKRYYKNGVLLKNQTFTAKDGQIYNADSFGYIIIVNDDINPGHATTCIRDLMYGGEKYYLFISTEAFIYGKDGKCYVLDDSPETVSEGGYKIRQSLKEDKKLTSLIKSKKPLAKLKYTSDELRVDFEITVKEFDKANLYANGQALDDYGLTIVSSNPYCSVDGVEVYLCTTATRY